MKMNNLISINKASKMLGVSQNTLRAYGEAGIIQEVRTMGGHRRYLLSDVEKLMGLPNNELKEKNRACCYCRVSSSDQKKHGDLERQKLRVLEYCVKNGYKAEHIFVETSSGMNSNRPKLKALYELVKAKKIDVVVIEHRDRLTRFMFDVFKEFFQSYDVSIVCIEQDLPKSFEAELVTDIIGLMTSFVAKIHSHRNRQSKESRRKIEEQISS